MNNLIEAFREYLTINKALSKNSISAYVKDLEQFSSTHKDLLKVDTKDIIKHLSQFDNKRTLNRKLSSINAFYKFCSELEFLEFSVDIPSSKVISSLPIFLSHDEIMDSLKNIKLKSWLDYRDIAIILFLYATGVRVSELISLERDDINEGWVRVRFAKGQKERVIPIAKIAEDALNDYLEKREDLEAPLFINYKLTPISRISVFKITKKYLGVSPHILRHSYATSLITGGADLRVVQELLGHSSLLTTQIYTHIQKSHLKNTLNIYHPLSNSENYGNQ